MKERFYDAFRNVYEVTKKSYETNRWIQILPNGETRYCILCSGYGIPFRMVILDNYEVSQQFLRILEHGDLTFREFFLKEAECSLWRDWIGVYMVPKTVVSEENKASYLEYAKKHQIKVGGKYPYPIAEQHIHNQAYTQELSEADLETVTLALEGFVAARNSGASIVMRKDLYKVSRSKMGKEVKISGNPQDGFTWKKCVINKEETYQKEEFKGSSNLLSSLEKIRMVEKLPPDGSVDIGVFCPYKACQYAYGPCKYPGILGIRDDQDEDIRSVTILTDCRLQVKDAWETLLDLFLKRNARPQNIRIIAERRLVRAMFLPLMDKLQIAEAESPMFVSDHGMREEGLDIIEEEEVKAENEVMGKLSKSPKSYVIRATLVGSYKGEKVIRELQIDQMDTFEDLHHLILRSVRFDNDHGFEFTVPTWEENGGRIGDFPEDDFLLDDSTSAYEVRLASAHLKKGMIIPYVYDFGDCWRFQLKVTNVLDEETRRPKILSEIGKAPKQYDW